MAASIAMTDTGKGKRRRAESPQPASRWETPFATLELVNAAGQELASFLGQPEQHRSRMQVQKIVPKAPERVESDLSEDKSDTTDQPVLSSWKDSWKVRWPLYFEYLHVSRDQPYPRLSIGRGSSKAGLHRGVDILIPCSGKGVISVHAFLRLDPTSGFPLIGGVKDAHPVRLLMTDGRYKELRASQCHVLCQPVNRFFLGELECTLTYPELGPPEMDFMRRARDSFFKENGLPAPDRRLPVLPGKKPLIEIGGVLVYEYIASGGFGFVGIGVNVWTGTARAVKSIRIMDETMHQAVIREAKISLRLSGEYGILNIHDVSCNHGHFFPAEEPEGLWTKLSTCDIPEEILITSELAQGDFGSIRVDKLDFQVVLDLFSRILYGLSNLHNRFYMHRDITIRNMLIMSLDPPRAVLCDFGKTIKRTTRTSANAGPITTQAPEIDGVHPYTTAVDIWSCGYAFARVLIPNMTTTTRHNDNGQQDEAWIGRVSRRLTKLGKKSLRHRQLTDLVKEVLAFRSGDRPTARELIRRWPEKQPVLREDEEGPPRKLRKLEDGYSAAGGEGP